METKSGLGHHIKILLILIVVFTFLSGKYLYALTDHNYYTSSLTKNNYAIGSLGQSSYMNVIKAANGDISISTYLNILSGSGYAVRPYKEVIYNSENTVVAVSSNNSSLNSTYYFGQLDNLPVGTYRLEVINGDNVWLAYATLTITQVAPATPLNFRVTGTGRNVQLTWDRVHNALGYDVYRGTEKITTTDNHYTFEKLDVGTHIFYVDAYNSGGTSPKSPGITYDVSPPSPTVSVDDITATTANISWVFDEDAISYDIFVNSSLLANTVDNSYLMTNLNESTDYNITIIAKSSSGNSGPGKASFKTLSLPDPPSGLRATNVTSNSIDLSWNTVDGYISYILDRDGNILASTGGNTYKVSGLEPDTAYTFKVAVETHAGHSVYSDPVEIRTLGVPPETPSGLSYDGLTTSGFKVYWLRQDNTESYNVYLNNVLFKNVKHPLIFNPSCEFTGLDPNKGYSISIVAINKWGMSSNSEPLMITTISEPPADLRAYDIKPDSVRLTWTSVNGAIKYIIDQNGHVIATTTANDYLVTDLTPNTHYQFRVAVETAAGTSQYSSSVEIKTLGLPPEAPAGLSIDYLTDASFTLYWIKQADADSYDIYMDGELVSTVSQPLIFNPKYEFDNLNPGTSYNIKITAKNEHGESRPSDPFMVTTLATPPTGLLRVSNITANSADLKWTAISGATEYRLYQDDRLIAVTSDSSFKVTGLESLTSYSFKMSVDGSEDYSEALTFTTLGMPPGVPGGLTYTNLEDKSFVLEWEGVDDSTSYNIFLNDIFVANVSDTAYLLKNLTPNSAYVVTINAQNIWGTSELSDGLNILTLPEPPRGFKAININSSNVSFTWVPVDGAISYQIKQDDEIIATVTDSTYTVYGLEPSTRYKFQVSVTTTAGQSDYTDPVTITTLGAPPGKPINLSVTNLKQTSFTLHWPNQKNVEYYNVYLDEYLVRKVYGTNYTFTGLEKNQRYKVKIVAANEWGQSPASDSLIVMTAVNPFLSVSLDGDKLILKWDGSADAFLVFINDEQVFVTNKNEYVYEGELGKDYKIKVSAVIKGKEFDSNVVYRRTSSVPFVDSSTINKDVTDSVMYVAAPLGGLLALALALKGSPLLVGIAKSVLRWF